MDSTLATNPFTVSDMSIEVRGTTAQNNSQQDVIGYTKFSPVNDNNINPNHDQLVHVYMENN